MEVCFRESSTAIEFSGGNIFSSVTDVQGTPTAWERPVVCWKMGLPILCKNT